MKENSTNIPGLRANLLVVTVTSYKKAQVFKRDYLRFEGNFGHFAKTSGNHSHAQIELPDGQECDARGSVYRDGVTRWDAARCQSWARLRNVGGKLVALDFDGHEIPLPAWVEARLKVSTPEEVAAVEADGLS